MYSPTFPGTFSIFLSSQTYEGMYSTIHISIQKILVIFANAIFFYLMGEIRGLNYFDLVCRYIDLCKRWFGAC